MGQRSYEWRMCRRAGEAFKADWGVSVKRSLLLPLMFLLIGLLSHAVSDQGNPLEEFNVWVHYTLVPAVVLGVPVLVWYLGRAPYRAAKEKDEEIKLLREPLKFPPQVYVRAFGMEFKGSTGRFLIFPYVWVVGRVRGHRFDLHAEVREWRHGKMVAPFESFQAVRCLEWEQVRAKWKEVREQAWEALPPLQEVSRFEGLTMRGCYIAFKISEDFLESLESLRGSGPWDNQLGLVQVAIVDSIRDITLLESTWVVRRTDPEPAVP